MKKRYKVIILISIILNVLLSSVLLFYMKNEGVRSYFGQKYLDYKTKNIVSSNAMEDIYSMLKTPDNSIIMLGDSLTDGILWNELFDNNEKIINRGIGGNKTSDILERLGEITNRKPKKIFLMIGINDLANNESNNLINNYNEIIKEIKSESKGTEIYIQSILPINNEIKYLKISNEDIINTNHELKKIAEENNLNYIDLYNKFLKNDLLDSDLTIDGVHLNANGYKIWKSEIDEYINN